MRRAALFLVGGLLLAAEPRAYAEDDADTLAKRAVTALHASHPDEAITAFEALADRGIVDPNVSFDRGLAYAMRVQLGGEVPGDLGRAVHGFEEARSLDSGTLGDQANDALAVVRSEIAHRRAQSGEAMPMEKGRSMLRSVSGLLRENVWGAFAATAAAILAAALALLFLTGSGVGGEARRRQARVVATMTAGLSLLLSLFFSGMTVAARNDRLFYREGVVVLPNARLMDARGIVRTQGGAEIPEGAKVRLLEDGTGMVEVAWGDESGWIPSGGVRPIAIER